MLILRKLISRWLYPVLLVAVIIIIWQAIHNNWEYKMTYGITTLCLVTLLITVETLFPLAKEWKMTGKSFLRDLKYIVIDAPTIGFTKAGFGILAIYYSQEHKGLFTAAPFFISLVCYLLVFEFFQYWYHRLSHTGKGKIGRFLWKVHVAHHLPEKVYVVMHAVFNPVNAFIVTVIVQAPLILLGVSPEVALAATLLIDLQSLVSHFNVDIRAGVLNYVFIGTETHRYHHSADMNEAKNFGNTLSIWDIVFGTFYYKPGSSPKKLGVGNVADYPSSDNALQVMLLPFRNDKG